MTEQRHRADRFAWLSFVICDTVLQGGRNNVSAALRHDIIKGAPRSFVI